MSKQFLNDVNHHEETVESFQKEKFEKIKPDLSKYYILATLIVLTTVAAYFFLNQKVSLVDFTGWTEADALVWADNNNLQFILVSEYNLSEVDLVLSQSIPAGEAVAQNTSVTLTVSLGANPDEHITIPDFDSSWTKSTLVSWLKENQIENYTFATQVDDTQAINQFVSLSFDTVTADTFTRSDSLSFVVTTNTSSTTVTVVDFSNYNQTQIKNWASENGVKIVSQYVYNEDYPADRVITQSIASNSTLKAGETITLTISLGSAVTMPYFASYTQASAKTWAQDNTIELSLLTAYSTSVAKGVAIYQDVAQKTVVASGSKLTLTYSLGSSVIVPSYATKSLTELQSFIEAQNSLGANLSLNVTSQYDAKVGVNKIISQTPQDTSVAMGSTLQVVISKGALVSVPNFSDKLGADVNTTYNAILSACSPSTGPSLNCRISLVDDASSTTQSLTQSIGPSTLISSADLVDIVITY